MLRGALWARGLLTRTSTSAARRRLVTALPPRLPLLHQHVWVRRTVSAVLLPSALQLRRAAVSSSWLASDLDATAVHAARSGDVELLRALRVAAQRMVPPHALTDERDCEVIAYANRGDLDTALQLASEAGAALKAATVHAVVQIAQSAFEMDAVRRAVALLLEHFPESEFATQQRVRSATDVEALTAVACEQAMASPRVRLATIDKLVQLGAPDQAVALLQQCSSEQMRELLGSTVFAVVGSRLFRSIRDARVAHAIFVRVLESAPHVDAGVLVAYFQSVVSHSRSPAHVRRAHALVVDVIEGGLCSGDDATFWRKLVTVCASSSLSSHAFHHLRRLLKRGMPCDAVVLRSVVQALAGTRNWRLMHELVSLARVYSLDLDMGMCQQLLAAATEQTSQDAVQYLSERLQQAAARAGVPLDHRASDAQLHALVATRRFRDAERAFAQRLERGGALTSQAVALYMKALCEVGKAADAFEFMPVMKERGVELTPAICEQLMNCCESDSNNVNAALGVLRVMNTMKVPIGDEVMLTFVRIASSSKIGQYAALRVLDALPAVSRGLLEETMELCVRERAVEMAETLLRRVAMRVSNPSKRTLDAVARLFVQAGRPTDAYNWLMLFARNAGASPSADAQRTLLSALAPVFGHKTADRLEDLRRAAAQAARE